MNSVFDGIVCRHKFQYALGVLFKIIDDLFFIFTYQNMPIV